MTADQVARKMRRRAARVETEFRKTMRGVGISAVEFTKQKMVEEIYAIPEDTDRHGNKKWTRTHQLLRGERYEVKSAYQVVITNDAPYAKPRHEAGKPGHRRINPVRESHWRDELVETFRPILVDALHLTLRDILRNP